jgi:PAS domain S-box-containing protein
MAPGLMSEDASQLLAEAAIEAIAIHEEGVLVAANSRFFELFGYLPAELIGRSIGSLLIAPASMEAARAAISSGRTTPYEGVGVRKDGTEFPIEIRSREREHHGRRVRAAVLRDVSERVEGDRLRSGLVDDLRAVNDLAIALGAARGLPELYSTIAEKMCRIAGAAFVVVSSFRPQQSALVVESVAVSPKLGHSLADIENMLGGKVVGLRMPLDPGIVADLTLLASLTSLREVSFGAISEEAGLAIERALGLGAFHVITFADDRGPLATCMMAMRRGAPPPSEELRTALARVASVALSRVVAEDALRESEARFSTTFHASPLSTAITRMDDGCLFDVNLAWTRLTGVEREEAVGRTPVERGLWVDPGRRDQLLAALRAGGDASSFAFQLRRRSGEICEALMSAAPVEVAGRPCMLTMAVDITDRKHAE